MEMAKYILSILKANIWVFYSWSASQFFAIENGLQFKVSGFKFKGNVRVIYNEGKDLFTVQLIKKGEVVKTFDDVYFDELVSLIDHNVEYCENYESKVVKSVFSV